jgi:hypothetical protein
MPPPMLLSDHYLLILLDHQAPIHPKLQFSWTKQAAEHNLAVLQCYNMDLDHAASTEPTIWVPNVWFQVPPC